MCISLFFNPKKMFFLEKRWIIGPKTFLHYPIFWLNYPPLSLMLTSSQSLGDRSLFLLLSVYNKDITKSFESLLLGSLSGKMSAR